MEIPNITELNGPQLKEKYFAKHYKDFCNHITQSYGDKLSFQEKLYLYYNNLTEPPACKMCGTPTKFINAKEGYRLYCSRKCMNSDPTKINATKQTNISKYGGVAPLCSSDIKEKAKTTIMNKYGVDNIMKLHSTVVRNKKILTELYGGVGNASQTMLDKYNNSCLKKYGVKYASQTDEFKAKVANRNINAFGYKTILMSDESHQKSRNAKLLKIQNKFPDVLSYTYKSEWICKCPHSGCDECDEKYYIISSQLYRDRLKDNTEPCTRLLPVCKNNNKNTSLEIYIKRILDKHNITYITNDRSVLNGKELDIYIPSKSIAIECNGMYSHCDKYKDANYHYNKYKECKLQNIQLITIWEDWIKNKPEIVESLLLSKLGIFNTRVGARKCIIREIDSKSCNDFLNNNHIQGACQSKVRLGLYYNNILVSVMSFGKQIGCSGNKNNNAHILKRFCALKNWQVIGGANKLLQYYITNYKPQKIESFACNDISNGDVYKKLGFKELQHNNSYWYVKGLKRYHRSTFTKAAIVKLGWKDKVDNTWTEKEVMKENGYNRIYDCGQTKYYKEFEYII